MVASRYKHPNENPRNTRTSMASNQNRIAASSTHLSPAGRGVRTPVLPRKLTLTLSLFANAHNNKERKNGPPALSRGRPSRARISRHAQAQHQPTQAIGEL